MGWRWRVVDSGMVTSRVFSLRGLGGYERVQVRANKLAPPYLNIARRDTRHVYVHIHTSKSRMHTRTRTATNERVCVNTYTLYVSIQNKRPPVIQRPYSRLCLYSCSRVCKPFHLLLEHILITNKKLCSRTFNRQQRITAAFIIQITNARSTVALILSWLAGKAVREA